ncbi:hypothetical protein Fmac_002768 [Flemingia macrophylla]|uniref:Uncharacterized protein n=1 Tax=Flemingia macrophylla TaxID=520843 RepID=A0ABD1NML1_9FABA
MSEEYVRSVVDLMVLKGHPMYRINGNFSVGDQTRVSFSEINFGWKKPIYEGPVGGMLFISFLYWFINGKGVDGIMVPIVLPHLAMKMFFRRSRKWQVKRSFILMLNSFNFANNYFSVKNLIDHLCVVTVIHMGSNGGDAVFSVRQGEVQMVVPAKVTPNEVKHLSDIDDDQEGLRMHISFIMLYKCNSSEPAKVIKRGISEALVEYYPLAGRMREGPNRKLMVECSAEGILFLEAEADVALEQLGDSIRPPSPHTKHFLCQVPVSRDYWMPFVVRSGVRMNHVVCDSFGLVQFLKMVATLARDPHAAIQPPVWRREIFGARVPPRVTCIHHEYQNIADHATSDSTNGMAHESFFFGPSEILVLRKRLPLHLQNCSTFELLSACLWKCRTMALNVNPNEEVGVSCFITAHGKVKIPDGYYGNAFVFPIALSKASLLCRSSLGYALGFIRETKARIRIREVSGGSYGSQGASNV